MLAPDRGDSTKRPDAGGFRPLRLLPLAVLLALGGLALLMGWHRELSLENLVRHRAAIDGFVSQHQLAAIGIFILVYVALVALSLPGALIMTVTGGVLFGTLAGGGASVIGATIGATLIFLIAKSAFGEHLMRRAGALGARLAEGFREDAFSYLLFLRLVPAFPFFIVNLVPAVAGVRTATFIAATLIGIIPATFAFAFAGAGLDSAIAAQEAAYRACIAAGRAGCQLDFDLRTAFTPQLMAGLVALGVAAMLPVLVKRFRARRAAGPAG